MSKYTPKLFSTLRTYSKQQFYKDILAGIIVAIIALPLSIALAIASGASPEAGIYAAIVGGFFVSASTMVKLQKFLLSSQFCI